MVKENSGKVQKIQKNVELVSLMASQIEEMKAGEKVRVTPFAKSITLSSGSHPHVETVKGKLMEAYLWQDITKDVKFFKKGNSIGEIEKIEDLSPNDIIIRRDIRNDLATLKNRIDIIESTLSEILKYVKKD